MPSPSASCALASRLCLPSLSCTLRHLGEHTERPSPARSQTTHVQRRSLSFLHAAQTPRTPTLSSIRQRTHVSSGGVQVEYGAIVGLRNTSRLTIDYATREL